MIIPSPNSTYHFTTVVPQGAINPMCLIKCACVCINPGRAWDTCWQSLLLDSHAFKALRISNQSTFLNNTPTPWTMCAYLISSVPCAGMCAKRWVWRGIQFLVLADQVIVHLYICCFEVVHIWLIRGRTRELDVGPSPKWPNVKTTFAAERKKRQNKTTQESISCQ